MVVHKAWGAADLGLPAGPEAALGILAFEAAGAMSKLLSLHRSLSEKEVVRLRSEAMRAPGVAYLNSTDQAFLLRLACAELVALLDAAAAAVARLGLRCGVDFAGLYAGIKAGSPRAWLHPLVGKGPKVKGKKMERLVAATAKLCTEMEALNELEAAEHRLALRGWSIEKADTPGSESFQLELKAQRLRVRRLKEESLWSQSYDKAVRLMACAAYEVFARVCDVFGPYMPGFPPPPPAASTNRAHTRLSKLLLHPRSSPQVRSSSGPIQWRELPLRMYPPTSNSCPIIGLRRSDQTPSTNWQKHFEAPPSTVGGAGLDLQYANMIVSAERLLQMESEGRQEEAGAERTEMYEMMPARLRAAVRTKLRGWWRDPGPPQTDAGLAEGWKEAAGRILSWLGPMARDTARWHAERSVDRQRRFDCGVRVLALQTLRWADREKTEAAVVEVLVALCCVCWYEERRRAGSIRL